MVLDKMYPIPILGGLVLQIEPVLMSNWAAMVGAGGVALVAVVVTLDKLGLLKKFGNGNGPEKELKQSLDSLGKKVDQLTATLDSQVTIVGGLTSELKENTKAVGEVHRAMQVQEEVRRALG